MRAGTLGGAASLLLFAAAAMADDDAGCDLDTGRRVFEKCVACHSLEAGTHLAGPSLYGIIGRPAGSADGYLYTLAMEQAGFAWDEGTLSAFLEDPFGYLPGAGMPFAGLADSEEREALVCWLARQEAAS